MAKGYAWRQQWHNKSFHSAFKPDESRLSNEYSKGMLSHLAYSCGPLAYRFRHGGWWTCMLIKQCTVTPFNGIPITQGRIQEFVKGGHKIIMYKAWVSKKLFFGFFFCFVCFFRFQKGGGHGPDVPPSKSASAITHCGRHSGNSSMLTCLDIFLYYFKNNNTCYRR